MFSNVFKALELNRDNWIIYSCFKAFHNFYYPEKVVYVLQDSSSISLQPLYLDTPKLLFKVAVNRNFNENFIEIQK